MNNKDDLWDEINKKANKIRERREKAKQPIDIEQFIIDFFKEAELLMAAGNTITGEGTGLGSRFVGDVLVASAADQLEKQIQNKFDKGAKVTLKTDSASGLPDAVQVNWSPSHYIANKCEQSITVGIEILLFK